MGEDPGLFEILQTCRAIRRLKPDVIPEEFLVRLVEAANWGPSGANRQVARWVIVRDQARKNQIAQLNRVAVEAYLIATRAAINSLPQSEATSAQRVLRSVAWQTEHLAEAPALIVPCIALGLLSIPPQDTFVRGLTAGGSLWPGVQNLLLAARAMGLGATLTVLALTDRSAFKKVMNLPDDVEPVCLIPVGYPLDRFGPVSRRPVEEVLYWDTWPSARTQ